MSTFTVSLLPERHAARRLTSARPDQEEPDGSVRSRRPDAAPGEGGAGAQGQRGPGSLHRREERCEKAAGRVTTGEETEFWMNVFTQETTSDCVPPRRKSLRGKETSRDSGARAGDPGARAGGGSEERHRRRDVRYRRFGCALVKLLHFSFPDFCHVTVGITLRLPTRSVTLEKRLFPQGHVGLFSVRIVVQITTPSGARLVRYIRRTSLIFLLCRI